MLMSENLILKRFKSSRVKYIGLDPYVSCPTPNSPLSTFFRMS